MRLPAHPQVTIRLLKTIYGETCARAILRRIPHISHRVAAKVCPLQVGEHAGCCLCRSRQPALFLQINKEAVIGERASVCRTQMGLHFGVNHAGGQ